MVNHLQKKKELLIKRKEDKKEAQKEYNVLKKTLENTVKTNDNDDKFSNYSIQAIWKFRNQFF